MLLRARRRNFFLLSRTVYNSLADLESSHYSTGHFWLDAVIEYVCKNICISSYPTLWRSRVSVDKFESTGSTKVEKLSIMAVDKRAIAAFGATEHISDTERWARVFVIIFLNVELITFSLVPAGNDLLQTSKNLNCHFSARFTIIRFHKTRI